MKNRWYHYLKPPVIGDLLNRPNEKVRRRSFRVKMLYAFIYPFSSGIVIYAGLMTFSVVVTNVTGLLPQMARDLYSGNLTTAGSIFGWLFAFFSRRFFCRLVCRTRKTAQVALPAPAAAGRGGGYFYVCRLFGR